MNNDTLLCFIHNFNDNCRVSYVILQMTMITKFDNNDIERIIDIWEATNINAHNFIRKEYWINSRPIVQEMLPLADIYVINNDISTVGFIGINQQHIEGIFIDQEYQSYGYGKQLLDFVKEMNCELSLTVYEKNHRAREFYKREGFTELSRSVDENTNELEIKMIWMNEAV